MDILQELYTSFQDVRGRSEWALPLSAPVRSHLRRVYETLAGLVALAAAGSFVHSSGFVPGLEGGILSLLASVGCLIAFQLMPPTQNKQGTRTALLGAFAFFQGLSLGPGIEMVAAIQPGTVTTALGATALLFATLSLSVLVSAERNIFFVASLISALAAPMFWISIVNMFLWSPAVDMVQLYLSLAAFSLFVVFDTQMIIIKAEDGNKDHLRHALELFADAAALFVRILVILTRRQSERDRKNRRSDDDDTDRRRGRRYHRSRSEL